ncbi:hypothetical protein K1T71_012558 [Dendrolimus kikuchii]|uniref:Uncharacterized protein n=1 Tax=Dendrolimus kikuchii TaxID=765133 RepID=A0ACC1CJN6_9NEOP|nr:hypothetical protein K1T71_012558 [Dendrolimus kikuchii]
MSESRAPSPKYGKLDIAVTDTDDDALCPPPSGPSTSNLNPNPTNDTNLNSDTVSPLESLPEIPQEVLNDVIGTDTSPADNIDFNLSPLNPFIPAEASATDPPPILPEPCPETQPNPQPSTSWQYPETLPAAIVPRGNPDTLSSVSENLPLSDETYNKFLKSPTKLYNTHITEHNQDLLKATQSLIIVPTTIDMDESIPYVQEILDNCSNPERDEFLKMERSLYTFLPLTTVIDNIEYVLKLILILGPTG